VGKRREDEERICAAAAAVAGAAAPSVGDFSPCSGGDPDETGATRLIQIGLAAVVLAVCVRGQAFHWTCGSRAYLYFFTSLSTADLSGCGLVAGIGILVSRHATKMQLLLSAEH
jgi:hypothetical protein